jgi:hypothetical protein
MNVRRALVLSLPLLPMAACSILLGDGTYAVGGADGSVSDSEIESSSGGESGSGSGSGSSSGVDSGSSSGMDSGSSSGMDSGSSSGVDSGSGSGSGSGGDAGSGCPGLEVRCSGTCVNTDTDAKNCGACGHDCLGASCAQAVCAAASLGMASDTLSDLVVDANNLYWSSYTGGSVMQLPKSGGAAFPIATGVGPTVQLAAEGSNVYFATSANATGAVKLVPIGGGAVTTIASGGDTYGSMALGTTEVYFATYTHVAEASKVVVDAGAVTNLVADGAALWLATDGTNLYWLEDVAGTSGTVNKMPIGGGAVTPLAMMSQATGQVLTDGVNVYAAAGEVISVPVGGGAVTTLAAHGGGISIDGSFVYFADAAQMIVAKVPLLGGPTATLAKNQASPTFTAVDSAYVYWNASGGMFSTPK